jgi:hypothetical protein
MKLEQHYDKFFLGLFLGMLISAVIIYFLFQLVDPTEVPVLGIEPLPTYTPFPEPDVLDWHIEFSSNKQTQLFTCVSSGSDPVTLFRDVAVTVTSLIVTNQIMNEVVSIQAENGNHKADDLQSMFNFHEREVVWIILRIDIDVTNSDITDPSMFDRIKNFPFIFKPIENTPNTSEFIRGYRFVLNSGIRDFLIKPSDNFTFSDLSSNTFYAIPLAMEDVNPNNHSVIKSVDPNELYSEGVSDLLFRIAIVPNIQSFSGCQASEAEYNISLYTAVGEARDIMLSFNNSSYQTSTPEIEPLSTPENVPESIQGTRLTPEEINDLRLYLITNLHANYSSPE